MVIEEDRRIYCVLNIELWKLTREVLGNPSFETTETDDKGIFNFFFFSLICSSYWKRMYVVLFLRKLDFSGKHGNHL